MREPIVVADSGPLIEALIQNGIYIRRQLVDAVLNDAGE